MDQDEHTCDWAQEEDSEYTGAWTEWTGYVVWDAQERRDGGWDVFVFEPPGACPEMEARGTRVDDGRIFIARVQSPEEFRDLVRELESGLGNGYECALYYREVDGRRFIGRIHGHLSRRRA